jgi:hypothetical protein
VLHLSNDFLLVIEGFIKYRQGGLAVRNLAYSKLLRVCWTFFPTSQNQTISTASIPRTAYFPQ